MKNIFKFWLHPAQAVEKFAENPLPEQNRLINLLFLALSLLLSLLPPLNKDVWMKPTDFLLSVAGVAFTTVLFFLVTKYMVSFLLWLLGKLFEGKAGMQEIRLAVGLSYSIWIILLPFAALHYFMIKLSGSPESWLAIPVYIQFIFAVISFGYLVVSLSKVSRISRGYALLCVLLVTTIPEMIVLFVKA